METIVIADCGSTSVDWAVLTGDKVSRLSTEGFNASALSADEVERMLQPAAADIAHADVIRFYGAGCREGEPSLRVERALRRMTHAASVTVRSDIYASIDATAPDGEAIVSILGTGSNSCRVADGRIAESIRSAGFILGDDGSGAAMGRELMGEYIGGRLPADLTARLEADYGITPDEVIYRVYRRPRANAFLGSFAPFLAANATDEAIDRIISGQMRRFVDHNIARLTGHETLPCHFTGSVAVYFEPQLRKAMEGVAAVGKIIKSPLEEIVANHLRR